MAARPEGSRLPPSQTRESAERAHGGLTVAQEILWDLHRRLARSEALNMFYALAIEGPLDRPALQGALAALCRRHEPLRTTYPAVGGRPVAVVHDRGGLAWEEIDLAPLEGSAAEAEAARLATAEAHRPFDLETGPLLRVALLALAADRYVLLVNFHHISADGWSLEVFSRELSALYRAARSGEPIELEEPMPLADYAGQQRLWQESEEAQSQLAFWRRYLEGLPARPAPPDDGTLAMVRRVRVLPRDLTDALQEAGRQQGASLFLMFLTALELLMARFTGEINLLAGTLVANRLLADSTGLLGAHYNPLLLRTRLDGDLQLGEAVERVVESALPALEVQDLPFHRVVQAGGAIPTVVLQVDRYPLAALKLVGTKVTGLHLDQPGARKPEEMTTPRTILAATEAPLTFFLREVGGRYTLSVFYRPWLLTDPEAESLVQAYAEILLALVDAPGSAVEDLPWPPPEPAPPAAAPLPHRGPHLFPVTLGSPVDALSPISASGPTGR